MPKQMLQKGEIYSTRLVVFSEPFDVRTDPGGDISLDRGYVCAVYMDQIETEKIGGVGKVVEIDESKFGKRKYNRGRRREGQWVLGGVERGSEEMFMQIVPSRDAATLLPVIIANVKPGTEIHTDEWRSYARLNRRGYVHHTAPEVIRMQEPDPYTFYCDVYSFGIVIYELVSGQLPYSHISEIDQILFMVGCGILRPDPMNIKKVTPKEFKQLFVRCSQFKKEDRPLFPQILVDLESLANSMPKIKRSNSEPSSLHYYHLSRDDQDQSEHSSYTPTALPGSSAKTYTFT
eukprot:Em0194g2a